MQVVEAAVELLESGAPDTVSTRAVAEHGYAQFLESKRALLDPEPKDAVEDLRRAWDTVVEFGATGRGADLARRAGLEILHGRVRRLAAGGWLRVDEKLVL